ncbi:MAG TPA: FtsW/RodA/SpoVE family cell cycle protein [Microthrixaceae bacterium]|nr:FtsW/RodA/SpoVE family cell cycle protein [Microthrixaceae bacterium]HNJ21864.1 FtsW/RodA/SpoVE family cell cycle protein [Microthrixaceae bacterium]HNJ70207.1 FtsW/RodA/SpoVE family cell cycle protein [Microthrixaceae bacterium]HNK36357.1 FtsW/RodA/SpoVE family cell cycle protein [Microthrixaceae bacterium]HPG14869.1 FtsW/RodA/SpoVE family cell cycle protein [Microthrixaceae bacterium]
MTAPAVTRRRPEPSPAVVALGTRRRTTELGLLVLAVLIILGAYALASLGRNASLPADIWPFLAVLLALLVGAHLANRRLARAADSLLLPIAALLNGIGYVFIARLDQDLAALQASWTAVGIVAYVVTLLAVRDVRLLQRYRYTAGLIGVLLLILPLLPGIGRSINGARIWVSVGPVSFQPGEFAKIAFAVFFAGYLVERRELLSVATFRVGPFNTPDPKHFAPILLAWGASLVVLIFQRDLGSALLFFLLFVVMLWVATGRVSYLLVGMGLFLVGAFVSWLSFEHVQKRVSVWIDPWADPQGSGYQIIQAAYALAWGGTSGVGPGLGIAERIPYDETDFIFAIIGEELGLLGTTAILCAFLLLAGTGLRVARESRDPFPSLLAVGLTVLIAFQAFIIMGGVTRLLPLTGVTLPFVSYGGSSLVANYVLLALLVRISDQTARRAPERAVAM